MSNIRVIEKKGVRSGKNLVILAGVHGNEVCGVKAFENLITRLNIEAGKVTFIYANLQAIRQNKRLIEFNLNRCFYKNQPEEISNTLEGKTAREIIPYLKQADSLLDIHASFTENSVPFVISDKSHLNTAKIFDSEIVVYNIDPFHPGSTDYYMNLQKKQGFCFECGYLGDQKTQEIAEKAIINFLVYNKCIKGRLSIRDNQTVYKIKSLYKNKFAPFIKSRFFADFEILCETTLIGKEGERNVYGQQNQVLLFVRDNDTINQECFLIAEKI